MPKIPGWDEVPTETTVTPSTTELTVERGKLLSPQQRKQLALEQFKASLSSSSKSGVTESLDSLIEEDNKITKYGIPRFKGERGPTINGCTWRQIQFLEIMYSARGPLTRQELCIQSGIDYGNFTALWLGRVKEGPRAKLDANLKHKSLLTKGYVVQIEMDIDGEKETSYYISDLGRKAFELIMSHPRFPR